MHNSRHNRSGLHCSQTVLIAAEANPLSGSLIVLPGALRFMWGPRILLPTDIVLYNHSEPRGIRRVPCSLDPISSVELFLTRPTSGTGEGSLPFALRGKSYGTTPFSGLQEHRGNTYAEFLATVSGNQFPCEPSQRK